MTPAVEVHGVTKRFRVRQGWIRTISHPFERPTVTALRDVSLEVAEGECFGLLGPNGAGKTTLFKVLATLILPDEGTASVLGHDAARQGDRVRRHIAPAIPNERSLYWRLSAHENLRLFGALLGLSAQVQRQRIDEVLEVVGLSSGDTMVAQFSTGMKQRLLIARALLAQPKVLLLDEPTRSLDPMSAEEFRRFLREDIIHRHGCTVLLATHDADEVRDLCNRVAVIDEGSILTAGATTELMAAYAEDRYRVWTTSPDHPAFLGLDGHRGQAPDTNGWVPVDIPVTGGDAEASAVLAQLIGASVPVARFHKVELSLAHFLRRVIEAHPEATRG